MANVRINSFFPVIINKTTDETIFTSPLKRPPPGILPANSPVTSKRKLELRTSNPDETSQKLETFIIGGKTSSRQYLKNLPLKLRRQAVQIEKYINGFIPRYSLKIQELRSHLLKICENPLFSEEEKYDELGLLYFYYANGKQLPTEGPLMEARMSEIKEEALSLKNEHKELCRSPEAKSLPSGYVTYIMRAFVRMIFTTDGGFNPGGCSAVKQMVNGPLGLLLTEEMRQQISTVIDKLTVDEKFLNLIMQPFMVHKDLKELILIDLKLPLNGNVNFNYVRWDLLIALFSIVGQGEEGNCFAVAPETNFLRHHCDVLLKLLIDVLKTGKLEFDGVQIPVLTLLESRRKYEKDFKTILPTENIAGLTALSVTANCFAPQTNLGNKTSLLQTTSLHFLMSEQFKEHTEHAKEIFISLKQNMLQQLLLSIMQFIPINSSEINTLIPLQGVSWRLEFFKLCKSHILDTFEKEHTHCSKQHMQEYLARIENAFLKHFFLVDYRNWKWEVNNERITFEHHSQGFEFETSDFDPFMFERRLLFLQNDKLIPVDTLTNFGHFLEQISQNELKIFEEAEILHVNFELSSYIKSQKFKKQAASVVFALNPDLAAFSADKYERSDSLFLVQKGGDPGLIFSWKPFNLNYKCTDFFKTKEPLDFFRNLCEQVFKLVNNKPAFLNQTDPLLLASTEVHAFNLYPLRFKEYWKKSDELLRARVIDPARSLEEGYLSIEKQKRALQYVVGTENVLLVYQELSSTELQAKVFRKEIKMILKVELHKQFDAALDRVLVEISQEELVKNHSKILAASGLMFNQEFGKGVENYIIENNKKHFLTPYEVAKIISNALLTQRTSVLFHKLEQAVCRTFNFPECVYLGNLNWTGTLREKPSYTHLILHYDRVTGDLIFSMREKGIISPLDENFAKSLLEQFYFYYEA